MNPRADSAPERLRSRVLRGVAWKAASTIVLQLSRSVVAVILARLLTPQDWGLAAMVLVLASISVLFTDSALGTALIQKRTITEADRSTVFWSSLVIGVTLAAGGIALSGVVASFYGEADVQPLFAVLSLSFLVTSLAMTQTALLIRELDFRRLELRQMGATLAGASVGIAVALDGHGAWAIVLQQLTTAVVGASLIWALSSWRPTACFSVTSLRSLGGFTGNVFAQNLLYQLGRSADKLLIGRYLGAASLGAYALASTVMLAPFSQIAAPLQQVLFPAFAQMQDDRQRLADVWIRVARLVGSIAIPASIGLMVVAPDLVAAVLGDRWRAATPVIQILAVVGLIQSVQTLNGEILLALGRAGTLLRFTILWFVASVGAIALALVLGLGIVGVAVAYAIATAVVEPTNAYLTARALGISVFRFVGAFAAAAQAAAIMGGLLLGLRSVGAVEGMSPGVRLLLSIALGAAVYVPLCLWRSREVRVELSAIARSRRRADSDAISPA